jgi:hypothetical protein
MTKSKMTNIELGLGIIKNSVLDNLEKSFKKLDLDDDSLALVLETIENEKVIEDYPKKSKKKVIHLDRPKREIAPENQCKRKMKNGEKCRGIKTNNITNSCWGHMTAKEKEEHRLSKNKPTISNKKHSLHRKAEDEADE